MKTVALFAGTESTRIQLKEQLEAVLQGVVNVETYATDTGNVEMVSPDLVVLSTELIRLEAEPWIAPGCPCITARRTLDMSRIDELFSVPPGENLLLVNDTQETAEECINLIKSLGVTHFTMTPYYPGCGVDERDKLAITPGEVDLVPGFVSKIIDIGARVIDMTTVVEILERLELLNEKANLVSARYLETIVRLHRELHRSLLEKQRLNDYLTQIVDGMNDGIVGFDRSGEITMLNQRGEEMLGVSHRKALGKKIHHFLGPFEAEVLLRAQDGENRAVVIGGKEYILNRFSLEKVKGVVCTIRDSAEKDKMQMAIRRDLLRKGHVAKYSFDDILGSSPTIKTAISNALKLSPTELTVLIHGETGTGKELFASAIHRASLRAEGPFLAVNFSAIPEELLESELFGYVEGAFTGASKGGRKGLFEQADGGTLFLDEIGDVSPRLQARLLRVLQEKEIMRVGGTDIITVDVRIIAATHRSLPVLCSEGKFREDLYFRLKRLHVSIPPLRDRKGDILVLFQRFALLNSRPSLTLSKAAYDCFCSYDWPGNVRELESAVGYLAVVCDDSEVGLSDLPPDIKGDQREFNGATGRDLAGVEEIDEEELLAGWIKKLRKRGIRVGRRSLSEYAAREGVPLSENRIRRILANLEDQSVIRIYRGRRGIELYDEGK